jgi:Mn2+/Fe2+ NRAMP family transporter
MSAFSQKLGPGLLLAASAVGVSHLVQSTRAGAEFGFTMAALIIAACLVKYPAFRFGAEYAAATGESVIEAYARQGRWLLVFFLVAIAVEGLVVIPAVSLVAAGMTMNLLGFDGSEVLVTMAIVAISSVALAFGRYRLLERTSKLFVAVFAVLTVVATVAAATAFGQDRPLAAPIALTRENLFFSVAVAGWMPVGMGGAVFISLWVCAKSRLLGRPISVGEARFDFNLGYTGTVVLALCFLLMGTALLFGRGIDIAQSSVGFAGQFVALFAGAVGPWVRVVIGVVALAVMFSTVLTVIDGFPRVYANVSRRLLGNPAGFSEERLYLAFLIVQAAVALALLIYLLQSFGVFIDFATTAGFVTAPVIAFLNHRVIGSARIPAPDRPPPWLKAWSAAGVAALSAASLLYLYFRFL